MEVAVTDIRGLFGRALALSSGSDDLADLGLHDLAQCLGQELADEVVVRVLFKEVEQGPNVVVRMVGNIRSPFRVAVNLKRDTV